MPAVNHSEKRRCETPCATTINRFSGECTVSRVVVDRVPGVSYALIRERGKNPAKRWELTSLASRQRLVAGKMGVERDRRAG